MSLLLEALKKAEKAKQDVPPAASPGPGPELSLEEEPRPAGRSVNREPDGEGRAATGARSGEKHAADQLFAAKSPPSRRGLIVAGGVLLVVLLAGGAYVWYEISVPKGSSLVATGQRSVAPISAPPAPAPAPASPPAAAPAPPPGTPEKPAAADAAPGAGQAAAPASAPGAAQKTAPPTERRAARGAAAAPAPAQAPDQVRFRRSQAVAAVDPNLAAGYEALARGDTGAARENYSRALRSDPAGRDAMLGLAAAEARGGNAGEALRLYQRLLELDPRDPLANAGLAALRPPGDPTQTESRLKLLLVQHPDSAALHFTLGNLLAGQSRWAEAQQEYFRAFSLEPANADYAFNLAVSLDQINQRRLAADHYRKALALGGSGAVGFDRGQAEERLRDLEASR